MSLKKECIFFQNALDSSTTNKVKDTFIIPTENIHCKNQFEFSKKFPEY